MRDLEEEYAVTKIDASSDIGSLPEDDTLVRTEGRGWEIVKIVEDALASDGDDNPSQWTGVIGE